MRDTSDDPRYWAASVAMEILSRLFGGGDVPPPTSGPPPAFRWRVEGHGREVFKVNPPLRDLRRGFYDTFWDWDRSLVPSPDGCVFGSPLEGKTHPRQVKYCTTESVWKEFPTVFYC